ncbi:unnamed protein product [Paramecium pentaurelia]|uniref:Uncharacterized protein n=1 Tax=Paramecium pentaurelia TaxID=43138 RepID=A0A8S1T3V7_9CILI|nr:unnamed protein product [Paramecium pentaurelia]
MIKFALFHLRNPFIHRINFSSSTAKAKQRVLTKQQEQFVNELKTTYQSLADNLQSEESVLNLFKKDQEDEKQQSKESPNEKAVIAQYMNILNYSFAQYYQSLSPEEQLKRSKDIIRSDALKKDWDTLLKENRDYQDYSLFDKNLLAIKYSHKDYDAKDSKYKNKLNFYGDLDENVHERQEKENVYSFIYQNPENKNIAARKMPEKRKLRFSFRNRRIKRVNRAKELISKRIQDNQKWLVNSDNFSKKRRRRLPAPKLSFRAKFELFGLFNEGWSVRDLSIKYGIMPYRVKAIIYQKRYFFDEVFPHLPFEYVRDLIAIELYFEKQFGAVDYGVDLQQMRKVESGYLQTNFKTPDRNVDIAKLSDKEQERIKKLFEEKKSKKYDIVTEKFQGQGNKGYYLKSWIMHKTRSRHGVNRIFERIIKDSDKPFKLPVTVQARLNQGPRIASTQFGHK